MKLLLGDDGTFLINIGLKHGVSRFKKKRHFKTIGSAIRWFAIKGWPLEEIVMISKAKYIDEIDGTAHFRILKHLVLREEGETQ